jgi:hypothetical protein
MINLKQDEMYKCDFVCRSSEDQNWYRARVLLKEDDESHTIQFVDYGNFDKVKSGQVYTVPEEFSTDSPYVFTCSLHGLEAPESGNWPQSTTDRFATDLTQGKNLVAEVVELKNKLHVIKLLDCGVSIADKLLEPELNLDTSCVVPPRLDKGHSSTPVQQAGVAMEPVSLEPILPAANGSLPIPEISTEEAEEQVQKSLKFNAEGNENTRNDSVSYQEDATVTVIPEGALSEKQKVEVMLSYTENPSQFWVQKKQTVDQLDNLSYEMANYYNNNDKSVEVSLNVASYCATVSAEDEQWYRAKILSFDEDKVEVLYVDFGNKETVKADSVRALCREFASLPCAAMECCLAGVGAEGKAWSEEARDWFIDSTLEKCLLMEVLAVATPGVYLVKLLDMGTSIALKMIQEGKAKQTQDDAVIRAATKLDMSVMSSPEVVNGLDHSGDSDTKPEADSSVATSVDQDSSVATSVDQDSSVTASVDQESSECVDVSTNPAVTFSDLGDMFIPMTVTIGDDPNWSVLYLYYLNI